MTKTLKGKEREGLRERDSDSKRVKKNEKKLRKRERDRERERDKKTERHWISLSEKESTKRNGPKEETEKEENL